MPTCHAQSQARLLHCIRLLKSTAIHKSEELNLPPLCQATGPEREIRASLYFSVSKRAWLPLLAQSAAVSLKLCITYSVQAEDTFRAAISLFHLKETKNHLIIHRVLQRPSLRASSSQQPYGGRLPVRPHWSSSAFGSKCWEVYSLSADPRNKSESDGSRGS